MTTDQQQEQPSASDEAWNNAISDDARTAINEETDGSGWARRWWQAEAELIELRRQKDDEL
jgi:hypothetical protein